MKPKIRLTAENLKSGGPLESVLKRLEKPKVEPAAGKKGKSGAPADIALDASAPLSNQVKASGLVPTNSTKLAVEWMLSAKRERRIVLPCDWWSGRRGDRRTPSQKINHAY